LVTFDEIEREIEKCEKSIYCGIPKFLSSYRAAKYYLDLCLSVVPLKYREKRPIIKWKEYMFRKPRKEEVDKWFLWRNRNIGIVCGKVSGNLAVIDFESPEVFKKFLRKVRKTDLARKVANTWIVRTGKGYHIYFRVKGGVPRTRLRLPVGVDIKGEGGYVVAPPSIHPMLRRYTFITNPDVGIAELSLDEWNRLLNILGVEVY